MQEEPSSVSWGEPPAANQPTPAAVQPMPAAVQPMPAANQPMPAAVQPSLALHVLALFMKGQKTLYMDAKSHCERRLNWLMLPAIINAAVCTVISSALSSWAYGPVLLATLSAFNSCVLAVISYLKLDAKCEAHRASAFQFERLQTLCEFYAGKYLFGVDGAKSSEARFSDTISEIETKMREIKDSNQFMLPKTIRARYPRIYTTNVFAILRATPLSDSTAALKALEGDFYDEMTRAPRGCCGRSSNAVAPAE